MYFILRIADSLSSYPAVLRNKAMTLSNKRPRTPDGPTPGDAAPRSESAPNLALPPRHTSIPPDPSRLLHDQRPYTRANADRLTELDKPQRASL